MPRAGTTEGLRVNYTAYIDSSATVDANLVYYNYSNNSWATSVSYEAQPINTSTFAHYWNDNSYNYSTFSNLNIIEIRNFFFFLKNEYTNSFLKNIKNGDISKLKKIVSIENNFLFSNIDLSFKGKLFTALIKTEQNRQNFNLIETRKLFFDYFSQEDKDISENFDNYLSDNYLIILLESLYYKKMPKQLELF